MSSGAFVSSKYQATSDNGGGIYSVRLQPETLALTLGGVTNAAPAGEVDKDTSAYVGGSTRRYGMHCAIVYLKFNTAPTGYKQDVVIALPLLTTAIRAVVKRGVTGTYLGENVTVVGKRGEVAR